MPTLPRFLPSTQGLHFPNAWPHGAPGYVVDVAPVGRIRFGDAGNGLCGGMAFTASDIYLAQRLPPAATTPPGEDDPVFRYVSARMLDSFDLPHGVLRYYSWANTPDADTGIPPLVFRGIASRTILDQIPKIAREIDAGRPANLGLVTVHSLDPAALGKCHQVVAYGYSERGRTAIIRVYDPNQPDRDDVTVMLDTSHPSESTGIRSNVDCLPLRGFFVSSYVRRNPQAIAGPAW
ncbi:hypothetical protein [Microbacterium deminutum]|uniref:Peptidase C39-like domain-containing protein n=1 Tax=Microbacterium deminutum TaxID=344164 RepID=A0ABN2QPT2_9MICO